MAVADREHLLIDYTPVGAVLDALYSSDREVLIEGPAGTGKTVGMMWHGHLLALKYPGIRILLIRKVGQDLSTGALDTYHKSVKPELIGVRTYGGSPFLPAQYKYPNGSVIVPAGLDKSDKVMSSEWDLILVNEVTLGINLSDWEDLTTRLRNGVMPFQQIMGDCNPSHAKHWANERCQSGQTRRIRTTHKDNPRYWNSDIGQYTDEGVLYIEKTLSALTGVRRKRLFEGAWASSEGLVYEFDSETMEVRNEDIDLAGWRRIIASDIGGTNPTAILRMHISGDHRVHVSKCMYRRQMDAEQIVSAIEDDIDEFGPDTTFIDPSAKMIIDTLIRHGYAIDRADNAIEEGIRQVQSVLRRGFTIDPSCIKMIQEFGEYTYPQGKTETDKPVKANDHSMDALRYGIVGSIEPVFDLKEWYDQYA